MAFNRTEQSAYFVAGKNDREPFKAFRPNRIEVGKISAEDMLVEKRQQCVHSVHRRAPAPGTPSGANYSGFRFPPVLNNAGQIAFRATLTGSGVDSTNNSGIWSDGFGSLALVARAGSQAPGTASGVNYSGFTTDSLVLNNAGQTAFYASLTGSGVDSTNSSGIWATDRTGALQLIARTGDPLEVAPGEFRTIYFLDFVEDTPFYNAAQSKFNNLGQLVFLADFSGLSRDIFVSNRVAVPEASSLLLAALAAFG